MANGRAGLVDPVGGGLRGLGGAGALGVGFMVAFVALEQGIALELGLDIGLQLEVRQLQKLDRLLQLRRDDKALALPEL